MNEERLPIWSAAGRDTGRSETKTAAHLQGLWHPVAQIWLCRTKPGPSGQDKGEIEFLLQLRSGEKDNFPNCWDVSVAGHVSAGESIEEGALRELYEELGIELTDLHFLFRMPYYAHYENGLHDCEWQHVYLAYLDADFDSSQFRLQQSEVSAVRWVTLAQLRRDWTNFALHYKKTDQGRSNGAGFALHRHYPSESGPIQKMQNAPEVSQIVEPNAPQIPMAPRPELAENHYWKEFLSALQNLGVL